MNLIKKILFAVGLVFPALLLPAQIAPFGISNRDRTPFESAPPDLSDSIVQLTAEAQGLQLVPPDQIPFSGTFWTIMPGAGNMALPYPCPPLGVNLPTYSLPGGSYLVDYTASTNAVTQADLTAQATLVINLIDQAQAVTASQSARPMARMLVGGLPIPGGGGTNTYGDDFVTNTLPIYDYGTNLWLAQVNISSNYLTAIASNTFPDVPYEIQSWSDLDQPTNWVSQGFFLGSETTNWTPLTPLPASRTNNFYVGLRSWASSDGSGLPDWWELEYFGALGINPNALDSAGDGFTIYQKFIIGVAPNVWVTPAAPQNFTTSYNLNTSTETVTWSPSPGPVTSYTLSVNNENTGVLTNLTLAATNTSFSMYLDAGTPDLSFFSSPQISVIYGLAANYGTNGSSAGDSQYAEGDPAPSAELVYGADGRLWYMFQNLPGDLASVRIYRQQLSVSSFGLDYDGVNGPYAEDDLWDNINDAPIPDGYFEIPAASITNSICELPDSQVPPFYTYKFWVQTVRSNGAASARTVGALLDFGVYSTSRPLVDARRQLKDNLMFSLRAADDSGPFAFQVNEGGEHNYLPPVFTWPDNYVYADFYNYDGYAFGVDALMPLHQNYFYRNFLFDQYNLNTNGFLNTGCAETDPVSITNYPAYYFDAVSFIMATNPAVPSSQLTTTLSEWILPKNASLVALPGGTWEGDTNYYGLPYVSETIAGQSNGVSYLSTVSPGQTALGSFNGVIYNDVEQPGFQSIGYYFARFGTDPLPEQSGFSPSGTQPLMLAGVGNSLAVAGYNNLAVTNGNSGVYGYLGQYFAGAYQINTSGDVTANSAGIVSPYGVFSPTVPGPAALVTMPDIDTGEQGTCTVSVISLQLSKNPAADMTDTSFNSPDATSPANPMVFWVNNNYDRYVEDKDDGVWYDDDVLNTTYAACCPYTPGVPTPDCNYLDADGYRVIPCGRDLEDFSRLWVCGVTSNLLAALPPGSTVTLSWGSVSSGNPAIDLFAAADADGGNGYLTNNITAENQTDSAYCPYIGRVGAAGGIQLNASTFANHWAGNHFIWCGVSNGTGGLNLTIADGSGNVLAQTTAYIQLQDIKQMYERWTVGDQPSVAPLTNAIPATEGLPTGTSAFQYTQPPDTNTPYILYVHGWNMSSYDKDRFAETAFKRLYWQGYQGRFGMFRWPTTFGFTGSFWQLVTDTYSYNNGESNAWNSAAGLLNKLNDLNAQYPGHVYMLAHSMGNVVAGEALRLAGSNQVVNTYVASQAAVPAHAYDSTVTNLLQFQYQYPSGFLYGEGTQNYGPVTPNIYDDWLADNDANGAGHIINFYNQNDWALAMPRWGFNQVVKPDDLFVNSKYSYLGGADDPPPWTNFVYETLSAETRFDIADNVNDRYRVMAYAAQAYSTPLGATPGVLNLNRNVDLTRVSPTPIWPGDPTGQNYIEHFWHSAEFRGDYWQQQGYWSELLGAEAFNLK